MSSFDPQQNRHGSSNQQEPRQSGVGEWLVYKELYTLQEVAGILSLSVRTVETLIANGYLRSAIAPGTERSRRVSKAMIEEYIQDFNSQHPPVRRLTRRRT